ncbi:type II toxin-antitoxin system RelE/ParE family toxin [Rhodobacter sp. SY28-1]|uniref:type II toxin-antitoxin system RelE family toxin n=1 Tax=Rhodobacter sp. SY28-1 TaxID=2562317 RepID=UPI0010C01B85|nr:type II toxin-antitoxin system RelE/ParE family toxin [Rhodobacter sp. SY28-1]
MTLWTVEFDRRGKKDFLAIKDMRLARRIQAAIYALADDPRPPGCRKLEGRENEWRIRVGTWRVIYQIEEDRVVVLIVRVAPRGEVYW